VGRAGVSQRASPNKYEGYDMKDYLLRRLGAGFFVFAAALMVNLSRIFEEYRHNNNLDNLEAI
jgi:hypothetical protein